MPGPVIMHRWRSQPPVWMWAVVFDSTARAEVNGMDDEEEEEEEEMMLEEENIEAEPQIEVKGAEEEVRGEEANVSPGPSHPAGTTQPPDEEQAGLEQLFLMINKR